MSYKGSESKAFSAYMTVSFFYNCILWVTTIFVSRYDKSFALLFYKSLFL
jgi:hypothetical protein